MYRCRFAVLLAALLLFAARPASAVTLVFASFSYVGPATVTYDNATGILSGIDIPVQFNYVSGGGAIVGTPATGFGPRAAKLNFMATRQADAATGFGLGAQALTLNSFSLTLDTPMGGLSNLLSGMSSSASLYGVVGGTTASFDGSMGAGATIAYASDFLTFPPPTDADFAWALQSVTPILGVSGANFKSFDASVAGSFGYNASPSAVPEGSSLMMLAVGLLPIGLVIRRRMQR